MLNAIRHNFRAYFRARDNFIWNLIFPFAYMAIFLMAMHSLGTDNLELPVVNIAIVDETNYAADETGLHNYFNFDIFLESIPAEEAADWESEPKDDASKEKPLLLYKKTDKATASEWLKQGKTFATVYVDAGELHFEAMDKNAGFDKSMILDRILNAYEQNYLNSSLIMDRVISGKISPEDVERITSSIDISGAYTMNEQARSKSLNPSNVYYYAMIGYIAFFPVVSGANVVAKLMAPYSSVALRNEVSPVSKRKRFISGFLPVLLIHCLLCLAFFAVAVMAGAGLEENLALSALTMLTTTLAALFLGTAVGSLFGKSRGALMAIGISVPLFFGFTSGMMQDSIRNLIAEKAPWIHAINPIGNTSNALYFLNVENLDMFYPCLIRILLFALAMLLITVFSLRRTSYASL
ncbi:MAG: ABC transporter permease [Clostridiales bacterium]|nr:ABC transporter permease [Clostridiales bacterium]